MKTILANLLIAGVFAGAVGLLLMARPVTAGTSSLDTIIQSCVDCHGPGGVTEHADVPSIAGLSPGVHEDAMFTYLDKARPCAKSEFRAGDTSRPATDMCEVAAALDEDQIIAVAAHFAEQPYAAFAQDFDAAKASAGEKVHADSCERCHSDGGSNPEDDAGILAGQPMAYMQQAMSEYRAGEREQPKKMKPQVDALSRRRR